MKKFFSSPWTISIATALISFLLTVMYDLIKGVRILSTIIFFLHAIWDAIITFLCYEIQLWWIIIGICGVLLILYLVSRVTVEKENLKPNFISYTKDQFRTWKWSWNWEFSYSQKKWHVSNLKAHCPQCNTPMLSDRYEDTFQCPRCTFQSQYDEHEKSYEVEAVIIDNLNRMKQSGEQNCV